MTALESGSVETARRQLSEEEVKALIARVGQGDVAAFEPLYRCYSGRVFALCLRMTGDRDEASELLQDVFVRCWRKIGTFEGRSSFATWLHRLAVNVVLGHRRSAARRSAWESPTDKPEVLDRGHREPRPDQGMDLERAIGELPPKARRVFVLHDIAGYRHDEIAEMTGSAPGTLRAHLHRARKILMEKLT